MSTTDTSGRDLSGSSYERVALADARFRLVDLSGARFEQADLSRVVMRGVELVDVEISGQIQNVTINGVDVAPLIEAELDRREPDRVKMRPTDAAGCRAAWDIVEQRWESTVARARQLDPQRLHESVDGEWSFIETLRHLAFATDSWIRRAVLGEPAPWDPLDLPWDTVRPIPGVPCDRDVRPSLDQVLALRHDRMATVRRFVDDLTDEQFAAMTEPVDAPGWPQAISFPVRECLLIVLNEEWHHREFAERDLTVLARRT